MTGESGMTEDEAGVTKRFLRKELLRSRDALDEQAQVRAEILITERILGHQWFYGSECILCFASFGSEIRTWQILEEAVKKGKTVFLPKVEGSDLSFYRYEEKEDLVPGYRGIMEPSGKTKPYQYQPESVQSTLLLMPGVGFDPYRNRLGYGKGFYDRFLSDKPELWLRSIAIGHACQMTREIPACGNDIRPYQVILV